MSMRDGDTDEIAASVYSSSKTCSPGLNVDPHHGLGGNNAGPDAHPAQLRGTATATTTPDTSGDQSLIQKTEPASNTNMAMARRRGSSGSSQALRGGENDAAADSQGSTYGTMQQPKSILRKPSQRHSWVPFEEPRGDNDGGDHVEDGHEQTHFQRLGGRETPTEEYAQRVSRSGFGSSTTSTVQENSDRRPHDGDAIPRPASPPPRRLANRLSAALWWASSGIHTTTGFNPSLTLENSGSVARDHLASERTFLAYVRTSLTIASTGVALVQLFALSDTNSPRVHKFAKPLGAVTIGLGFCMLSIGCYRYFRIQYALIDGHFPLARQGMMFVALVLAALVVAVFGIIIGVVKD